jgi:hypothetical protein
MDGLGVVGVVALPDVFQLQIEEEALHHLRHVFQKADSKTRDGMVWCSANTKAQFPKSSYIGPYIECKSKKPAMF